MAEQEPPELGVEDTYLYSAQVAFDSWIVQRQIEKGELSSSTTFPPRAAQAISEILSVVGPDSPAILRMSLLVDEVPLEADEPLQTPPQSVVKPLNLLNKLHDRSRWIKLNNR